MRRLNALLFALAGVVLAAVPILAHDVTQMGTVAAVKASPNEATNGVVAILDVKDVFTGTTTSFEITTRTKLWRGNDEVSFDAAHIQIGERVAVTINHDAPEAGAIDVRLSARDDEGPDQPAE